MVLTTESVPEQVEEIVYNSYADKVKLSTYRVVEIGRVLIKFFDNLLWCFNVDVQKKEKNL